jgi:plasmid stabilization system protein ParE
VSEVVLLPKARNDLAKAARYLELEKTGLGGRLTDEVQDALERLSANPNVGAEVAPGVRKLLVRRFPYSLIYRIIPEYVLVLAVVHHRRHPRRWQGRL